MTTLLLDVGNSRLKWGLFNGGKLGRTGHVDQEKIKDHGWQAVITKLPRKVDSVFVSNVAGTNFGKRLSGVIGAHCSCDVHFARSERKGWGVTNAYRQPRRLGVDRWVAMIAAWAELEASCLVVDAGTALTIDAIDDEGNHLGGQIIPGVETMLDSLASATSDIPGVKAASKQTSGDLNMFGKNTAAAVREGAQNAVIGAIERAAETLEENGFEPTIVLTGGGASRILVALYEEPLHRPHLVLEGLAHMLESAQ